MYMGACFGASEAEHHYPLPYHKAVRIFSSGALASLRELASGLSNPHQESPVCHSVYLNCVIA